MSRAVAFKCIRRTMSALFEKMADEFSDPYSSTQKVNHHENEFNEKYGIPWIIGVVDGSHIPIRRKSRGLGDKYYNRKKFMSIVLSAVVDATGKFLSIDVGAKGGRHDSHIFRTSAIGEFFQQKTILDDIPEPRFLLGDSAYSLDTRMMKAYDMRNTVPSHIRANLSSINSKIAGKTYIHSYLFAHLHRNTVHIILYTYTQTYVLIIHTHAHAHTFSHMHTQTVTRTHMQTCSHIFANCAQTSSHPIIDPLVGCRVVVEHAFGRLKRRFPFIALPVQQSIGARIDSVWACCLLHNFVASHGPDEIEAPVHIQPTVEEWIANGSGQIASPRSDSTFSSAGRPDCRKKEAKALRLRWYEKIATLL